MLRDTQVVAAAKIGIDPSKYCAFAAARRRPCLDVAARIEVVTRGYVRATQWAQSMRMRAVAE
jgi:hypothetical protein